MNRTTRKFNCLVEYLKNVTFAFHSVPKCICNFHDKIYDTKNELSNDTFDSRIMVRVDTACKR